ncbi:MAG: alpha/beta hydrolase [Candidatus Bathyarchaeota archaeon]|nr:alpha/beta hydrolase [Candidatus Bathyarchaeota archaeon]
MKQKLLIIHGWGLGVKSWQKVKELLELANIEVLLPELPGFGKEPSPGTVWGIEDYKNWILKIAKRSNWEKFNLLGHSFGGGLAVRIAADFPKKIEKLILCSPSIIREKSRKISMIEKTAKISKKILQKIFRERIIYFLTKIFYTLIRSLDYFRANGVMKETMKKVISEDLRLSLRELRQPTLLLWGDRDYTVPLSYASRIKKEIDKRQVTHPSQKVRLVVFPKVGHALNLQAPDQMVNEIKNFLND